MMHFLNWTTRSSRLVLRTNPVHRREATLHALFTRLSRNMAFPLRITRLFRTYFSCGSMNVRLIWLSSRATSMGLTKPTPHLSAILSRASTRTKNLFTFRSDKQASSDSTFSSNTEYRPSSVASFLSRLSSFKLATYANKPEQIDAVAASRCGWTNDGKDRLLCSICGASWVVVGREGMSREAGE